MAEYKISPAAGRIINTVFFLAAGCGIIIGTRTGETFIYIISAVVSTAFLILSLFRTVGLVVENDRLIKCRRVLGIWEIRRYRDISRIREISLRTYKHNLKTNIQLFIEYDEVRYGREESDNFQGRFYSDVEIEQRLEIDLPLDPGEGVKQLVQELSVVLKRKGYRLYPLLCRTGRHGVTAYKIGVGHEPDPESENESIANVL